MLKRASLPVPSTKPPFNLASAEVVGLVAGACPAKVDTTMVELKVSPAGKLVPVFTDQTSRSLSASVALGA